MAYLANGTQFHKLDSAGTAYEYTLTDVTNGGEIGGERSEIDITTLDSEAKESMGGLPDNGELTLEMLATVDNYSKFETDFKAGTINTYAVTFPFGTTESNMDKKFKGWVKSCKITGIEPDGLLKVAATIRISGELQPFVKPVIP